jgi:outer membrane lipoprotein LolB
MIRGGLVRSCVLAAVCLGLLAACATPAQRAAPSEPAALSALAERERQLQAQPDWTVEARVAVRNGDDGGSGQLIWRQSAGVTDLSLRAPVSGQGWRLRADADGALLEGLESGPVRGPDADRLLREAVGWDVPLALLARWVQGQRGTPQAVVEFDSEGWPQTLQDAGWRIEYRGWDTDVDPPRPRRVEAESDERRVRMVVRSWKVGEGA